MKHYFGTDGIRGKVGQTPITADFFLKLGWAVGSVLKKHDPTANVIIGKDTRVSGYMFESALEAGFLSAGVGVGLLGPMPTPAVAYLTKTYRAAAGVVISASHNTHEDNGIKFFSKAGFKFDSALQNNIEKQLAMPMKSVISKKIGKARRYEQAVGRYIEFCKSTLNNPINFQGLHIVLDCSNGATYHVAPFVFEELGAKVSVINNQPDGFNINLDCGATDTRMLQSAVIRQGADLGIAFDGDGDRVIIVDKKGETVNGDELLFIIAKHWHQQGKLTGSAVVGTQMSNLGMRLSLKKLGIDFIEAKIGDRFVMEALLKNKLILGGEASGHIVCLNNTTTGDGIISALKTLEVIVQTQQTVSELKTAMQKYAQTLINVPLEHSTDFDINQEQLKKLTLNINKTLADKGRVLIRPSGTEPVVRIMVEGTDAAFVRKSAEKLAAVIRSNHASD